MSDLQCAATFLVLPPTPAVSAERLRGQRPAFLYAEAGVEAAPLARELGVAARDLPWTTGPTAPAVLMAAFAHLADEVRGETIAVLVSDGTYAAVTREVLPTSPPAAVVEIDAESHRWRAYE